jgi:16S rRNA (adenine1518-N6/adenine1519-N6)-dimethyltransferase
MHTQHTPRKRFGQHFLCDQAVIQRIVAVIAPRKEQHLVEIGPGQGAITLPILKLAQRLDVVELDRDLIPELQSRTERAGELIVHEADALLFDFASLQHDARLLRVIGNLPYNISTPLIFHLLSYTSIVSDMVFMLQKEVADRLAAAPDSEHYGRLSVMTQYHCAVEVLFDVPPSAFFPPPKVESSIIRLIPHRTYPYVASDYAMLEQVVKLAFGQRRKTLRNSLRDLLNDAQWAKLPIQSNLRAEKLSVAEFVLIANLLSNGIM